MTKHHMKPIQKSARRFINLLIVSCLLLIPAGCSRDTDDTEDDYSFMEQYEQDGQEAAPSKPGAEGTPIKIIFPGNKPSDWNNVKAEIEKRTRDTLNISLDFIWKEHYSYISEIKTLQASNQNFDAFVLAGPDGTSPDLAKLARNGALKDITDIFQKSAPSLYNKYSNEELAYATIEGRLYAVPSLFSIAECPTIFANDSLIKKYRIEDITTLEQYEAFLGKLKENEPDVIPGIDTSTFIASLPSAFGYAVADERNMLVYKWDDPEMRLTAWEQTPEFFDTVNMFIDWHNKGYLKGLFSAEDYFKASTILVGGNLKPPSDKAEKISLSNNIGTTLETSPVRVYRLYPDKNAQRKNPMGKFGTNGSFAFTKESNNTEMVLRFLEWIQNDRDNYNLVVNGIEGTDYVINDGIAELPKGMNTFSSPYMYWDGHWAFMNSEYETAENKAQSVIEYRNSYSGYPPHGVFYPDYGMLEQAADKRVRCFQEFYVKLAQGQIKSTEQLEKFINDMKGYNTDELIASAQSQLTAD